MESISVSQMRLLEEKSFSNGVTVLELMERAGKECAKQIDAKLMSQDPKPSKKTVFIFCGPGNNGGDGLVIARYLKEKNNVAVVMPLEPKTDASKTNHKRALDSGVKFIEMAQAAGMRPKPDIIVDALLGIGAKKGSRSPIKEACRMINSMDAFVVSIDVPTGMDADTGECDPDAVMPDATICIHAPKIGELRAGKEKTGEIWVADIGL